jgi:hypothetical protein
LRTACVLDARYNHYVLDSVCSKDLLKDFLWKYKMGCSQTGKKTSCSVLEYIYSIDKELAEEIERNVYKKSNIEGFIFQASYYS